MSTCLLTRAGQAQPLPRLDHTLTHFAQSSNRIPIIAECASSTPLETLIADVLFVPNEIEVLDRLHVSQHAKCTANPTWGDIFKCCFNARSSKLERLFSLKFVKRDVRALSFELSKMSPQHHGGIG